MMQQEWPGTDDFGPREAMEYDVVIVGAGPSGLSAAIRLKQLAQRQGQDFSVCVLEKGSEAGAHILSGAVMDPVALTELVPDWQAKGAPVSVAVSEDRFLFLREKSASKTPGWMLPEVLHNKGNYVVSLANLVRWLAQQAEELGVDIFPGFAAAEVLYDETGAVKGVATGNMGVGRDGKPTDAFQ
ncbi:MAG: NAD(P)/FAD-dependent oxidoreductase, partial [Oxalobacter sp.]|nr:NAD(P)/FAD-dependent oxidoreductase [Oxalobacter sp.]